MGMGIEKLLAEFDAETFAKNIPGGFFIYEAKGKEELVYANDILYQIWGCETKEEFCELTGNSFRGMVHKDDLRRVEMEIQSQVAKSAQSFDQVEYRIIRKDGEERQIADFGRLISHHKYGNYFYVFVMDVTEKKQAEKRREFYEYIQNLKSIFDIVRLVDASKTAEYVVDIDGNLTKQPYECFRVWNKKWRCSNCISLKALAHKGQMTKFEFIGYEVYYVTAKYVELNGLPLVLEMVSKIRDEALFGTLGRKEFVDAVRKYNKEKSVDTHLGIYNRCYFEEQMKASHDISALAFVSVDNLDVIHETYGDNGSRQILETVSKSIIPHIGRSDTLVRYSENEILVIFPDIGMDMLKRGLEETRIAVEKLAFEKYPDLHVTVSIGAVLCDNCKDDSVQRVHEQLKLAKKAGNCVKLEEAGTAE